MSRYVQLFALALLLSVSPSVRASDVSFTGAFSFDTDLHYFTFTLLNPTPNVTLRTWSYAGGTNAAGEAITAGGFEPYLNLYFEDGTQMNPGSSGPCGGPLSADPITGACGDVYYPTTLSFPAGEWAPGTYIVVLSTFANPGIGNLSDGFAAPQNLGLPVPSNFTCQVGAPGYQGNPPTVGVDQPFCDEFKSGVERNGNWALDILNVDSAADASGVPEPGSLSLMLLSGAIVGVRALRTRRAAR